MEKFLELYKYIDGVNDAPFPDIEEHLVIREFRYDAKRMGGAPTISFTAMHRLCLDNMWSKDVYATFNGERYYIKQTPTSSYSNSDTRYKHEVELVSERTVLDNVYFYDVVTKDTNVDKPVSNSSKFTFFGDINEYVTRLNYSLIWAKVDYTIVIDEGVSSEEKQVTFENQVVTNALQEIYNIYQIPYYFVGKTIHIGEYQDNIDHVFKYGVNNSLLSISKNNANAKIINRITGVGSQDNIPYYYPNDDEKGVTKPLLNGSSSGVSISNQSRYRKVRLSDKFVFHRSIQTQTPLIDSSIYTLGDLTFDKKEEGKDAQYSVDFYYTFSLDDGENVLFEVSSNDESTVSLRYEIYKYKTNGNHLGYFTGNNTISLTGGTYNFIVRWTFLNPNVMFGVEEQLESLISSKLNIAAYIIVDEEQTWTLKNRPVSLYSYGLSVDNPVDGDVITIKQESYINPQPFLMPYVYRKQGGNERFYNAENNTYIDENGEYYVFENEYSKNHPSEHIENFDDIKPTIKNVTNAEGFRIDRFVDFAYDLYDNDEVDEEGKFIHKWFFAKLNKLDGENGFNLFDHAIDESEMIISMTSGSCGSCSFKVLVNKDNQKNTVQVDENGNLLRDSNGNVRFGSPQDRQNDTENYEVWIALEKDIDTFGVLMPNATNKYRPSAGDTFVILHIDLPKAYIEAAEKRLDKELIKYMHDNNFEKFNFSIAFSRIFFAENPSILNSLNENSKITIEYNGREYSLYVSSISIAMTNEQPLPEIKVELNDNIAVSKNQISQIVESTKKDILSKTTKDVFWGDIKGIPSWIGSEKPRYSYSELSGAIFQESNTGGYWVLKNDKDNNPYIYTELPVVSKSGYVSYANIDDVELPNLYDGLPIDNQTLYWEVVTEQVGTDEEGNPIYETTKVMKAKGGGSGGGVADSVHWDNIEGKPNFDDYATQDNLKDYLPLSGGTMTGQINMPVGIVNAIKFGEESRLFASNGIFYISAETHLVFASGASGNNVPNNVVINKDGRMFIANNLAVGHAGFIMDSYKLNVAGDAYVNGKLVVSGTIFPSISSLHNIGDSSKRFACVYADSVDVGGVKISLLQDGVLLIDGNLAVTGGITSYVDGGDLDLPSIYDGLPIDGDTLYWVLDENGNKVMLKSKGGDEEGGGSVKSLLRWSGFREGSWDGSEEKTIEIPSKLSELENDGFFKDYGWVQGDANEKKFGSYFLSGAVDNIPISNGQLLAFNGADGTQFFVWENHFYHRQNWGGGWHGWRKVISGDSNGVIDYDLTLGGSLNMPSGLAKIKSGEKSIIESYNEGGDTYVIGENYLYLTTKALFTIKEGQVYGILHEGNYKDYEYSAKNLNVVDIRNTAPKPSDIETFSVTAQFANTDNPGDGWYSGLSIQGWTNDYKAWQLRSGALDFASDHLYFRNGVLETWNDWRRVITGDVDGVLDSNLEIKGEEGGNIKFVYNSDSAITTNKPNDLASIRQALRFPWYGESYEIGTIRGNASHSDGFGITHQNNHLVWKVNRERMDVYGDLRIKNGLIRYNENEGYFYIDGNLVVSGGISSYVDVGNLNLPSIYDGLPLDMDTLGWKEVTDASGAKSKVLSVIGGIDESILWDDIEGKPNWIGAEKPSYSYSEIKYTPDLSVYAKLSDLGNYATMAWVGNQGYAKSSDIPKLDGYATQTWVGEQGYVTSSALSNYLPLSGKIPLDEFVLKGNLRLKTDGSNYHRKLNFGDGDYVYLKEDDDDFLNIYADSGVKIYDNTTDKKEYIEMTRSGITLSTTSSSYISMFGMGVKVNNGFITYNDKDGYWKMEGNLLVTGGITSYSSDGKATPFLINVDKLENITSDSKTQVYTANVVTLLKKQLDTVDTKADASETRISNLKTALEGLSASNVTALVSALKNLNF